MPAVASSGSTAASFAELVRERAAARGARIALRAKRRGLWQAVTWGELREQVDEVTLDSFAHARGRVSLASIAAAIAAPDHDDPARIAAARARATALGLHADDVALVLAPATWSSYGRDAIAEWLVAGFALSLPETDASVGVDLRELRPTYLSAPAAAFETLHAEAGGRLPPTGTLRRRAIDRALASTSAAAALLVRGPLRRALGWSRVRRAIALDAPLSAEAARFFAAIGAPVRAPHEVATVAAAVAEAPAPLVARAHAPFVEGL